MSDLISLLPKLWSTTLEETLGRSTPTSVMVAAFMVPYAIAYLVHLPNTRIIRIGLYPMGLLAFVWLAATIRIERVMSMRATLTVMTLNVGAGTRWAFSKSPPQYHALPRPVPYPSLRNWLPFKAFDLLYNENRHVNIAPYSTPLKRYPGSHVRLRRALKHLAWFWINTIVFDLASYPAMLVAPKSLGSPHGAGGDYNAWCRELAAQWGFPVFVVDLFWSACLFIEETAGFILLWDLLAFLGIASGVYIPEEWPTLTVHMFRSTSLNELWGKRWHQVNRDFYLLLARPFSFYRPLHILAVFLASAAYHIIIYFPVQRSIHPLSPYLYFYIGQATCCILERTYYKTTGRKVGGITGAIWTWSMVFLLARPMVAHEWSCGWAGTMRDQLAKEDGFSVAVKVFHALGWGPSQAEMAASAR